MEPDPDLVSQFPLFQMRDFDVLLNQGLPIGIDSEYPSELRARLSAASLSFNMGNKSVDHFRKHYLANLKYPVSSPDRLDKKIADSIKDELQELYKILEDLEPPEPKLGHMVAKWTFTRIPFSFGHSLTCAQRGALFECLAIVRMILEQAAWALEIRNSDDFNEITTRQAQQSLRSLRSVHPAAGNFYGWLSAHAHWTYDAHIKAFFHQPGQIGMRLADPLYKGQALGALLVLFDIVRAAYDRLFETLGNKDEVRNYEPVKTAELLRNIRTLAPEDTDICSLNEMLEL